MNGHALARNVWFWVAICSLCLNIALGSHIAIRTLRAPALLGLEAGPRTGEFIARRLPADDAALFRRIYRERSAELDAAHANYLRLMARVVELLSRSELDPAELRAAVKDAREQRIKGNDVLVEVFLRTLERMPTEARQRLVGRLRARQFGS